MWAVKIIARFVNYHTKQSDKTIQQSFDDKEETTIQKEKDFTFRIVKGITPELDDWMLKHYKSPYACKSYAEALAESTVHTFILYEPDFEIKHVFVFSKGFLRIKVVNEHCFIDRVYVDFFCSTCFQLYNSVQFISFNKQYISPFGISFRYLTTEVVEDYIIDLPASEEAYRRKIGKKIRGNINNALNRTKRDYPDYDFSIFEKKAIPSSLIQQAVAFNKERMNKKDIVSGLKESYMRKYRKSLEDFGFVTRSRADGKNMAMVLNLVVDDHLYFNIIAHDSNFNYYSPGLTTLFQTIISFIDRGGKKFHMMYGAYDYKTKLKGDPSELFSYVVFRNRLFYLIRKSEFKWKTFIQKLKAILVRFRSLTPQKVIKYLKKRLRP